MDLAFDIYFVALCGRDWASPVYTLVDLCAQRVSPDRVMTEISNIRIRCDHRRAAFDCPEALGDIESLESAQNPLSCEDLHGGTWRGPTRQPNS